MSRTVESDRVRAVARRFGRSWPAADASWRRKVRTARQVLVILAAPAKECLDRGGILHVVDLADHSDTPIPESGRLYRRPAISPAGDVLVAEGYQFQVQFLPDPATGQLIPDTTITSSSDLIRFGPP